MQIFLVLFFRVCVPCHAAWSLWRPLSEAPKSSNFTISSVTKHDGQIMPAEGADKDDDILDIDLFSVERGSSSSNRLDKNITKIDFNEFDDSEAGVDASKSSSQAHESNRKAIDESYLTAAEDDPDRNGPLVPGKKDNDKSSLESPQSNERSARVSTSKLRKSRNENNESMGRNYHYHGVSYFLIFLNFAGKLIAVGYPCHRTFKALMYYQTRHYSRWLMYWLLYACITVIECMADLFLFSFQLYHTCKVVFLIWCYLPMKKNGSSMFFKILAKKFCRKDEEAQVNSSDDHEMRKSESLSVGKVPDVETVLIEGCH